MEKPLLGELRSGLTIWLTQSSRQSTMGTPSPIFFLLLSYTYWTLATSAVVPPPVVKPPRHISLFDIRVSWEPDVTSSWNVTDAVVGYQVALSRDACVTHIRPTTVNRKTKSVTFWGVTEDPHWACVQTKTSNKTSDWGSVKIDNQVKRPPRIVKGPATHKVYYPSENISLPCLATGSPPPEIQWYANGKLVKSRSNGTHILPNGTLFIITAQSSHQGAYRCWATNKHGVAVSDSARLEFSVLEAFPHQETRVFDTPAGHSLLLPCSQKPHSVPRAQVTWFRADNKRKFLDGEMFEVGLNRRKALGPDGSLLFVFVVKGDEGFYTCDLWNDVLDRGVSGSSSVINVYGDDMLGTIKPSLLAKSSENVFALIDETAEITCIFSGRSTPDIIWRRVGGRLPDARHHTRDHNRTLVITHVTAEDAGNYECTGHNKGDNGPLSSQPAKFKLIVNARPTWVEKPKPQNVTVGENVTFKCRAAGIPEPTTRWLINGENIHMESQSTTSTLSVNKDGDLVIEHVTKEDMRNIQCNVSNSNGYLFTDAYLNVVYPTTIGVPPRDVILMPGHVVRFECGFESDPGTPVTVQWLRGNMEILYEDRRIYVTDDHTLVLNTTLEEDGGLSFVASYTCSVSNGIDVTTVTAKLRPPGTLSQVKPRASMELGEGQDLMLIGLTAGLAAIVIICLILLTVVRKRHQSLMTRSGTDTSVLTILSARVEEDTASAPPQCDMTEFPLLPYLDDESLEQKIKEVLILRSRIELGKILGKGQFGRVYAGMLKGVGPRGKGISRVAVKTLKYKPEETEIVELFLREAVMMKDFKHEHVLSLIGISVDEDGSPMVILPLMENSDLRIYVQDPEKEITVLELLKLGLQVARGMIYLSQMRFIHRDLAARNCMVDAHRIVKVADFGLSRDLFARDYYRIEDGKTPLPVRWMAPESLTKSIFTTMSDVWSYGVLLWELMTRGAVPYPDVDNWDIAHYIESGKRLAQPLYCPDSIYDVMLACWEDEPENRPTFERIVKDIEAIVDSARIVPSTSSHLYLNINSMAAVSDYREVTHTTV